MKEKSVNQRIHEWLGKCWHKFDTKTLKCRCGASCVEPVSRNPAYDTDLNKTAEVEAKVIEAVGRDVYFTELCKHFVTTSEMSFIVTASASVRCAAILSCIEELEGKMKATDEQIAVVEKMDDDDDFEPEPCEWCGQFLW